MDYGSRYADARLRILDARLRRVYSQAEKELEEKLEQFYEKKEKKNTLLLKKLKDGDITPQQYKDWLTGQAFMEKQWKNKVEQSTALLQHTNEEALAIIRGEQLNVFAENANYQAYQIEQDFRGAVSFDIYDKKTVENLVKNKPELLPPRKVNGRKDRAWNQGIIANCVTQGIIQGESIDKITRRIAKDTASKDMKAMRRYARTAMTSAQNAGRMEMLQRAQKMGIKVQKQWMATLDGKTRDSHRKLDGQTLDINKPFDGEFSKIMFPGDPSAHPAEVYNCRCTMVYVYPDYQKYDTDQDWRQREQIDGKSYEDWKESKKVSKKTEKTEKSELEKKLAGVSRGKPMTHEEADTGRVNPNFSKGAGYQINCQSCVVTYEARLRGYDVEVVPNDKLHPMCGRLARNTRLSWIDKQTGKSPDFMYDYKPTLSSKWHGDAPTPKRFKEILSRDIQEDARYHIGFGWKGSRTSGHIVTLGKKDGNLFIYDPQSDRTYTGTAFDKYLTRMKMQRTSYGYKYYQYPEVLRVDDKEFNYDVVSQIVKGVRQ